MLADEAAKLPAKKWATIAPNYEYGQSAVAAFKKLLSAKRPDIQWVGEQWPPQGKIDAGAVVEAIAKTEPDAIFNVTFGADLVKLVREGDTRGLFKDRSVVSLLTGEPEYLDPLKDETPEGWIVTGYPWNAVSIPDHAAFLKAYQAKYNDYPRLGSVVGYSMLKSRGGDPRQGPFDRQREARRRRRGHRRRDAVRADHVPSDRPSVDARRLRRQDRAQGRQGRDGRRDLPRRRRTIFPPTRRSRLSARRTDRSPGGGPRPRAPSPGGSLQRRRATLSFYFVQFVTGLASACSLFLVASGLSIIFGVTRVVNFAHGAFYMLGAYIGYTLTDRLSGVDRLLGRDRARRARRRRDRHARRNAAAAPHLRRAGTVSVARNLRRHARRRGSRAADLGAERAARSARARLQGRDRSLRPALPDLRPAADRARSAGSRVRCGCCSAARPGACWCARRRRTARWWPPSASTRNGCSPASSRSASFSPALGGALELPRRGG